MLPMPSWPSPLRPQHLMQPVVTSAHVWMNPKAMAEAVIPGDVREFKGEKSEFMGEIKRVNG